MWNVPHSKSCFAYCHFTWMFELHCAECDTRGLFWTIFACYYSKQSIYYLKQRGDLQTINYKIYTSFQVSPCGFCQQTVMVCPTVFCLQRWSGIIMTPATSNRTMYPNINTTDLQCTPNNTGCNTSQLSVWLEVLKFIYLFYYLFNLNNLCMFYFLGKSYYIFYNPIYFVVSLIITLH